MPYEKRTMKSQHRHELQTNELGKVADKVAHGMEGFFETYGNRLLIGFCVASVVAAIVIYKFRKDHAADAVAWRDLANARNAEDFAGVAESHPGTAASRWARVHEGETRLSDGVQLLFTNLESATKELKLAREALQTLVDQKGASPEIRERALFSLARCLEAASDGSEGEAVKTYQALLREFPATIYKKDAEDRIEALNSGSGQEFYAWFAQYERPKVSEKRPKDRKSLGDDEEMESSLTTPEETADESVATEQPKANEGEKSSASEDPAPEGDRKTEDNKPAAENGAASEGAPEKPANEPKSP